MRAATIAAIAAGMALSSCAPPADQTVAVLRAYGFTNVRLTGYRWVGCSDDDTFHEGFAATAAGSAQVTGIVCSGVLKGATVRLDG